MQILYKSLITLFLLLSYNTLYAATISAQLDVNPVLISDSFRLTYSAEGSVDDDPDFSPVKKDFELLGTQQSSNFSMINGDFKRSKKWMLTLRAKNTGTFRIPAIKFGSDLAPEVEVIVKEVPISSATNPSRDFIVELEASKTDALIEQQIIITARLLIAQNISSYQFSELRLDDSDTIIKPLGNDRQYKTYRGSKAFIIVEKQFAIFPQHTGILEIQPFVAEIAITSNNSRGSFFDPFNTSTTTKRIQSKKITIQVNPVPSSFTGNNWLPASSFKLIEDWPQNTQFKAGEPITRTITLMANGLTAAQIPQLNAVSVTGLKQYPDKPVLQDKIGGKGISSIRSEKTAFIPTRAGTYVLPAIDIPWWNTSTAKINIAHIAKRKIKVLPADLTQPVYNQTPLATQGLKSNASLNESPPEPSTIISSSGKSSIWLWISIILLILWLITLVLLLKSRKRASTKKITTEGKYQSLATSLKYLKTACVKNNPQEAKTALLNWAKIIFNDSKPNNLADAAELIGGRLREKILVLNTYLYSANDSTWQCGDLYELCRLYKPEKKKSLVNEHSAKLESFGSPHS